MDALVLFYSIVLAWISPLLAYPVLRRCPAREVEFWLAAFVLTSWLGLAVYLWRCYRHDGTRAAAGD